ncbi:hypothetical protein [Microbacterium luticocti]|uniref:hypothetical protein n=1 Tax=Microbacterium luticocti TaxID=451764 RepID=UPI00040D943A|nr:hypothetical protein [Microbacterium luticocti]
MRRRLPVVVLALIAASLAGCAPAATAPDPPTPSATPATATPAPPTDAELDALVRVRVLFGHQSIGMSILDAVPALFARAGMPAPQIADVAWPQVRDTADPAFAHAWIGANGDPLGKIDDFASIFDRPLADSVDIALMKLGAVDITATTDIRAVFEAYSTTMDRLAREHPGTVFVYATVTLTTQGDEGRPVAASEVGAPPATPPGTGTDNARREQYNALVRERYGDTGRLFDIADLESRLPDGRVLAAEQDGVRYRVMNPAVSSDGLHLNAAGASALATALLDLLGPVAERLVAAR